MQASSVVDRTRTAPRKSPSAPAWLRTRDVPALRASAHVDAIGVYLACTPARLSPSITHPFQLVRRCADKNLSAKAVALTNVTQIDLKLRIMQSIADQYTAGAGVRVVIFGDRRAGQLTLALVLR